MGKKVVAWLTPGQSEKDISGKNAPKPPEMPDFEAEAESAAEALRQRLRQRRGRAATILNAGGIDLGTILNRRLLG